MTLGRPVRANSRSRIKRRAVEGDKRDLLGLQMPDELGIAGLQPDQKFGAVSFDEFLGLVDQPLGGIRHEQQRVTELDVDGGNEAGEPHVPH